jgi:thermostable 8-oxoguanine DNA glycosylase
MPSLGEKKASISQGKFCVERVVFKIKGVTWAIHGFLRNIGRQDSAGESFDSTIVV